MHPAGIGIHHTRQFFGIGGLQFGQAPVLQNQRGQLETAFSQLLQHRLRGRRRPFGCLGDDRQVQLVEKYLPDLFRRTQIEGTSGNGVGLLLQRFQTFAELPALPFQHVTVDAHSTPFHARKDRDKRHLHLPEQPGKRRLIFDFRPDITVQPQRDIRIFRSVGCRLLQRHLIETQLLGALTRDVLVFDGIVIQILAGQGVHIMPGSR